MPRGGECAMEVIQASWRLPYRCGEVTTNKTEPERLSSSPGTPWKEKEEEKGGTLTMASGLFPH